MAEAVGLTVGVVALAGLFNNAIECFELVQLGRAFEKDFKTAQLKLDTCELRLSRWGASLGLTRELQPAEISTDTFGSESAVNQAKRLLSQILELFREAEGVSAKFKACKEPSSNKLAVCDPQAELDLSATALHDDMRELALARRPKISFKRRAKWALYEEKRFRRLLEDITDLVDSLIDLFPAVQAGQKELCEAESTVLSQSAEVELLKEIAAQHDELLQAVLEKKNTSHSALHHVVFSGDNNQGFQLGVNSGTISGFMFGKGT